MLRDYAETERLFRLSVDQSDTDACLYIDDILYKKGDSSVECNFTSAVMKSDMKAAATSG